jgi:hypothetical protein
MSLSTGSADSPTWFTAALDIEYGMELPPGLIPALEVILIIHPPPESFSAGTAARDMYKVPNTFRSKS